MRENEENPPRRRGLSNQGFTSSFRSHMAQLRLFVGVVAAFTLTLVCVPSAFAASASVATGTNGPEVLYTAASGEANDVVVTETWPSLNAVRIADQGAEINAGAGCIAESLHRVRCTAPDVDRITLLLGDRNDSASLDNFGYNYESPPFAYIYGGGGNDLLVAGGGTDRLYGGGGADVLRAGPCRVRSGFQQILEGGPGDDDLKGGGCDYLIGGQGADLIRGTADLRADTAYYSRSTRPIVVTLDGKPGDGARGENDNVGRGIHFVLGGSGDDLLVANDSFYVVFEGGAGNDTLKGGARGDYLRGNAGSDRLLGGGGSDDLSGQAGNDRFVGGPGRDRCLGGGRNDVFYARDGFRDFVGGGPGTDRARIDVGLDRVRHVERRF